MYAANTADDSKRPLGGQFVVLSGSHCETGGPLPQ